MIKFDRHFTRVHHYVKYKKKLTMVNFSFKLEPDPGLLGRMHVRLVIRWSWVRSSGLATVFHGDWSWNHFYGHSLRAADSSRTVVSFCWKDAHYRNDPKFSDTQNICCNHSKVWTMWIYHRLMSPNDADGAVWSGSALFAQACLSENLGSLR